MIRTLIPAEGINFHIASNRRHKKRLVLAIAMKTARTSQIKHHPEPGIILIFTF